MILCTFMNIVLIIVIATIMFGAGMFGGIPAWYRNIREGRSNCVDMKYANDVNKWDTKQGMPQHYPDKHLWNLAQTVQGDDSNFKQKLQTKMVECA